MKYQYLILDFGNVIAMAATGDWHVTPKFLELMDMKLIDSSSLQEAIKKSSYLLSEKMTTLEEEYDMFLRFYDSILQEISYPKYSKKLVEEIAYDRTYRHGKYQLCDGVEEELKSLKEKYTLLMLTDNWPCVIPYLKDHKLYDYFDKIYISSVYGSLKKDGVFFDYPIEDYQIQPGEALFIDDTESLLDVAKEKGLDVLLMDRGHTVENSKYTIIHDLKNI